MKYAATFLFLTASLPAIAADLPPDEAKGPAANDNLNAVLWDQTAVEAKATMVQAYALARIRFDEALADRSRTADPAVQTGDFANKPPAVVLDVDDTVLNTSQYQAWNVKAGTSFNPKTWTPYVNAKIDFAIPGASDFTRYAASRGAKVFYVTNRTKEEEPATAERLKELGFAMGDNVDTILTAKEQEDWGSAKSTRRAFIARDYRILLLVGDNLGDFTDAYKGSVEERQRVFDDNAQHWGKDWIAIPNPTYGSWESAAYGHDFKTPPEEQRQKKIDAMKAWSGP
ncbi:5'-nucleotidase, lipoprotein e(P4) family [Taklimakanibacter lacteus]|uniref:5'-nucleotidase, lipoprotein e(P4) family n=1 Tax=Taklimakanibacter lacteus TaxID=2268456 RepID=UPI000E660716